MTRSPPLLFRLRICLTILSVLALLTGTWAQAATPVTGPLTALVICGGEGEKTVWLDGAGNEHPAPHDCCDCALCDVAAGEFPQAQSLVHPATWQRGAPPAAAGTIAPSRHRCLPPSRGPPPFPARMSLFSAISAMAEDAAGLRASARTIPA
ncbi:DUF2946 family protein [Pseudogemmobacter humi]|uniref:DUF2946 domain-containing protein n=1 Tax=Pseudogemmobacter humi TaxID=2483812 RepID=A0A3P5WF53_9RHOB|nr:hypothetical protein [Pseudogemmobacter humi]VDC19915.1 hypothetical protein XINFAN_00302 [Pseudogemmobacter humi]